MGSVGALGFLMLFQYQNCAPANRGVASFSTAGEDQLVTTIDDVNETTGVSFAYSKVQVSENSQPTVVEGECDQRQDGAVLGWKMRDENNRAIEDGLSVCEGGKFQVETVPASELECDKSYHLTARLAAGTQGHVEIQRHCP